MILWLKCCLIKITRFISQAAFFFPMRKKQILFYSFAGKQYSDSPKYISDYILRHSDKKEYSILWAVNEPSKFNKLENLDVRFIKYRSFRFFLEYMRSKFIVTNMGLVRGVKRRKGQEIINTYHGGGSYKKDGALRHHLSQIELEYNKMAMKDVTLFISSCKAFTQNFIKDAHHYEGNILNVGLPRNDILINKEEHEKIKRKAKRYFGIDDKKHIVLYAPTWKNYDVQNPEKIDYNLLLYSLKKKFGGEWIVLYRAHNLTKSDANEMSNNYIYDATTYPDMQELLITADILITDYSSVIWDYSLLMKPAFLFVPDLHYYEEMFGFFTPIEKWGFAVCTTNENLSKAILSYNKKEQISKIIENHNLFISYETGEACKKVYEFIESCE